MEVFPYPLRQVFRSWIFEAFYFVEALVIELIENRFKGLPNIGKIDDPSRFWMNRPSYMNLNPK